jgi:hypothetical protein
MKPKDYSEALKKVKSQKQALELTNKAYQNNKSELEQTKKLLEKANKELIKANEQNELYDKKLAIKYQIYNYSAKVAHPDFLYMITEQLLSGKKESIDQIYNESPQLFADYGNTSKKPSNKLSSDDINKMSTDQFNKNRDMIMNKLYDGKDVTKSDLYN